MTLKLNPLPEGIKKYTKTKPMQNANFEGCVQWWDNREEREENDYAWRYQLKKLPRKLKLIGEENEVNFDWDSANISHIARHNVTPEEAEKALLDRKKIGTPAYQVENEQRWAVLGKANNGRILFIVFTRRNGLIRVVTARDAIPKEKRRYQR